MTTETTTAIDYKYVADMLRPNYRLINCVKIGKSDRKQVAIKIHINKLVADEHERFIRDLFAGNGLNISYDRNSEYLTIEIPE